MILFQGTLEELESTIKSMMAKKEGGWACNVCGFLKLRKAHVKDHVEAKHIQHPGFLCPHCDRVYASRHSLRSHIPTCAYNKDA